MPEAKDVPHKPMGDVEISQIVDTVNASIQQAIHDTKEELENKSNKSTTIEGRLCRDVAERAYKDYIGKMQAIELRYNLIANPGEDLMKRYILYKISFLIFIHCFVYAETPVQGTPCKSFIFTDQTD